MKELNNILLVDDHPLMRNGIKQTLVAKYPDVNYHQAESISEASEILKSKKIDVMFLDINLPDGNGIQFLKKLREGELKTKVIILSTYNDTELIQEAVELGVDAYLTKDSPEYEILQSIEYVMRGTRYLSPSVMESMIEQTKKTNETRILLSSLTDTERKVLKLVSNMKTSKEIAEELFLHYRTIENNRTNICNKLGLKGPNALLKFAVENKDYF